MYYTFSSLIGSFNEPNWEHNDRKRAQFSHRFWPLITTCQDILLLKLNIDILHFFSYFHVHKFGFLGTKKNWIVPIDPPPHELKPKMWHGICHLSRNSSAPSNLALSLVSVQGAKKGGKKAKSCKSHLGSKREKFEGPQLVSGPNLFS